MAHMVEKQIAVYCLQDGAAWHEIGTPISATGTFDGDMLEAIRSQPLLAAEYRLMPLSVNGYGEHPTQSAVVRMDDGKICGGVVGTRSYSLSQPADQWQLAARVVRDIPEVRLSFAAMLAEGARFLQCWHLGDFEIAGEAHRRYISVHTGFDGSYSTEIILSAVRAVCNNTVSAARYDATKADDGEAKGYAKIRRRTGAERHEEQAVSHMRAIFEAFDKLKGWSEALTKVRITDTQAVELVDKVLRRRGRQMDKSVRAKSTAERIVDCYLDGQGNGQWRGTAYGLWQGFTEYADHYSQVARVRDSDGQMTDLSETGRLKLIDHRLFGSGADVRETARTIMDDLLGRQPPVAANVDAVDLMESLRAAG